MGAKKGRRGAAAKTKGPGGVGTKASAREAKRKLIAAVRAGLAADAGGKALGEAFRSGFLEAGNYNQVNGSIADVGLPGDGEGVKGLLGHCAVLKREGRGGGLEGERQ